MVPPARIQYPVTLNAFTLAHVSLLFWKLPTRSS